LEGSNGARDDLRQCTSPFGERFVLNEHKEDEGWHINDAYGCFSDVIDLTANGERDGVTAILVLAKFVET
jgi:hypothetical protein